MKHPIFIVEGPDAVGKTTLCERFREQVGARYIHLILRKPSENMFLYQRGALRLALKWSANRPVLIDRHWPSENIYAEVYRGGTELAAETAWLRRICSGIGVTYIACHLDSVADEVAAHEATAKTGRELYEPDDRIRQVAESYRIWSGSMPEPELLSFNWSSPLWNGRSARLFIDYAIARGCERRQSAEFDSLAVYSALTLGVLK